jgi:hypothetical protein
MLVLILGNNKAGEAIKKKLMLVMSSNGTEG